MGDSRNNRNHRNNHRHVFRSTNIKRKHQKQARMIKINKKQGYGKGAGITNEKHGSDSVSETVVMRVVNEKQGTDDSITIGGSRIMNIEKLKEYPDELILHASCCEESIILNGETRLGLASILIWECCVHTPYSRNFFYSEGSH